jgi:hypothetical protein
MCFSTGQAHRRRVSSRSGSETPDMTKRSFPSCAGSRAAWPASAVHAGAATCSHVSPHCRKAPKLPSHVHRHSERAAPGIPAPAQQGVYYVTVGCETYKGEFAAVQLHPGGKCAHLQGLRAVGGPNGVQGCRQSAGGAAAAEPCIRGCKVDCLDRCRDLRSQHSRLSLSTCNALMQAIYSLQMHGTPHVQTIEPRACTTPFPDAVTGDSWTVCRLVTAAGATPDSRAINDLQGIDTARDRVCAGAQQPTAPA